MVIVRGRVVGGVGGGGGGTSAGSRTTFGTSTSAAGGTVGTAGVGSAGGRTPHPERVSANTNPAGNAACFMCHLVGRVEAAARACSYSHILNKSGRDSYDACHTGPRDA